MMKTVSFPSATTEGIEEVKLPKEEITALESQIQHLVVGISLNLFSTRHHNKTLFKYMKLLPGNQVDCTHMNFSKHRLQNDSPVLHCVMCLK